jgi:energy-coupling factor transporter ATP-binding protein EcfA2
MPLCRARRSFVIEVQNVTVERPGRAAPVLDGVSLAIAAGERAVLLGGNGSGKTTLARLLNGTIQPTHGRVLVDGHDTRDETGVQHARRAVALLFQDPDDQFVSATAEREIAFGLENLGVTPAKMRVAVDEALRSFGLEEHAQTPPHEMSGGEKARLALACTWVMQPRAVVLDETESLLDWRGGERLTAALATLPASTAILRITTDAELAASSQRVLVLHAGRIEADGAPDEVFAAMSDEDRRRVGESLVWRLSRQLAGARRVTRPTASLERLQRELRESAC